MKNSKTNSKYVQATTSVTPFEVMFVLIILGLSE